MLFHCVFFHSFGIYNYLIYIGEMSCDFFSPSPHLIKVMNSELCLTSSVSEWHFYVDMKNEIVKE